MITFGDFIQQRDPNAIISQVLYSARKLSVGIEAHAEIVRLFIDISELTQGLADFAFNESGFDDQSELVEAATDLLVAAARNVHASQLGSRQVPSASLMRQAETLGRKNLPHALTCRRAEGYAFYALYPEAYLAAAKVLRGLPDLRIIGLRSIGVGLSALAAVAAGAARPITLRPTGHPFRRTLSLSSSVVSALSDRRCTYAVVDEGPGLSGSSFGAVLDQLEDAGIPRKQMHVLPSHGNALGPQANEYHRARWPSLQKHVVEFDDIFINNPVPERRLAVWVNDLTGAAQTPLKDISGGAWRQLHYDCEAAWPASNVQQERRKYLLYSRHGVWLLKFYGLDRRAESAVERGLALANAGFVPAIEGARYGFLIEPWLSDATPLAAPICCRDAFIAHLAHYLGFRARYFEAAEADGASLTQLAEIFVKNTSEMLGSSLAKPLKRFTRQFISVRRDFHRVFTDNRLQPWEWLLRSDGRLTKTDAVDHACGHDVIGAQDIIWDVAGAIAEYGLSHEETDVLLRQIELASRRLCSRWLLHFFVPCYLAFQAASARTACQALADLPAETARLNVQADLYIAQLRRQLEHIL